MELTCTLSHMCALRYSESMLMLDVARNRLHRVELWMSLVTMAVAWGALVAGIFGMNLQSGLETNNYAFAIVAIAITALVAMLTLITSMCFGRTQLAGWRGVAPCRVMVIGMY